MEPIIRRAVEDAGLALIDLVDDFRPYAGREVELSLRKNIGATHPNAEGHELIARAIARELAAQGFLPKKQ